MNNAQTSLRRACRAFSPRPPDPPSLAKKISEGSPRAREQATALSRALRGILYGVRSASRPGRARLAKTMADVAADVKSRVFRLEPGARVGLEVISALEDVVTDEGEVSTVRVTTPPSDYETSSSNLRHVAPFLTTQCAFVMACQSMSLFLLTQAFLPVSSFRHQNIIIVGVLGSGPFCRWSPISRPEATNQCPRTITQVGRRHWPPDRRGTIPGAA